MHIYMGVTRVRVCSGQEKVEDIFTNDVIARLQGSLAIVRGTKITQYLLKFSLTATATSRRQDKKVMFLSRAN